MDILHTAATGRTLSRREVPPPSRPRNDPPYLITDEQLQRRYGLVHISVPVMDILALLFGFGSGGGK
ncbi:MAG: hypothetical protein O7H41_20325 [Planctomycetota bacterium]|nr:hypothetical protein [Planctomycetota bacterium]